MNNVKKTIGWCDYTWNPVKGLCPVACEYCYARRMYQWQKKKMSPEITLDYKTLTEHKFKPHTRVFVGSTIDLLHPYTLKYLESILSIIQEYPNTTFIILTKSYSRTGFELISTHQNKTRGTKSGNSKS